MVFAHETKPDEESWAEHCRLTNWKINTQIRQLASVCDKRKEGQEKEEGGLAKRLTVHISVCYNKHACEFARYTVSFLTNEKHSIA